MISFVLDAAGQRASAVHPDRLIKLGPYYASRMAHIVSSHLSRRVRQAIRVQGTRRVEQDPRRFNGVAGNTDNVRPLSLMISMLVGVDNPCNLPRFVVFDS